jgi:4-amino-4-deoxy-L-arabinose transferase-like glycosyltransferase
MMRGTARIPSRGPWSSGEERVFTSRLTIILLLALALRLAMWLPGLDDAAVYQGGDSDEYLALAASVEAAYTRPHGALADLGFRRPPGYPLLLAAARAMLPDGLAWLALVQVLIGCAIVAVTALVARRLFGSVAALTAALWVAVDPLAVVHSSVLLTETPFALALLVGLGAAHRALTGAAQQGLAAGVAGLALAAATFVRPITLYLPLLVTILLVAAARRRRRRWSVPVAFALASLLPILGWMSRNHALTGVFVFTTIEGASLLDYRAAGALEEEEEIPIGEARARARAAAAAETLPGMNAAERSRVASRVGLKMIVDHPGGYLRMAVRGLLMTLVGPGQAELQDRLGEQGEPVVRAAVLFSATSATALVLFAAVGAIVAIQRRSAPAMTVVVLPIVYLLVIGSGQESYSRFRVPLVPLLALLAGVAWSEIGHRLARVSLRGSLFAHPLLNRRRPPRPGSESAGRARGGARTYRRRRCDRTTTGRPSHGCEPSTADERW